MFAMFYIDEEITSKQNILDIIDVKVWENSRGNLCSNYKTSANMTVKITSSQAAYQNKKFITYHGETTKNMTEQNITLDQVLK